MTETCTSRGANRAEETNLVLPDKCLAVFVDDTGHEALVAGHPVYGLGGCAALACTLIVLLCYLHARVKFWCGISAVFGAPGYYLHGLPACGDGVAPKANRLDNVKGCDGVPVGF
jgi:hypothetical protein